MNHSLGVNPPLPDNQRLVLLLCREKEGKPITTLPVIISEGREGLRTVLPYLGIRHIVGALPWDSYAKAVWADEISHSSDLSIADISQMIGDDSATVSRLVEGV